jgi:hypothetical protein
MRATKTQQKNSPEPSTSMAQDKDEKETKER